MWWRFIIFCFLVSFILVVVLNYIHDRPVVHFKFFKKCCDDTNENEHVVFETFKDNFLKERLIAFEFVENNSTFVPEDVDIEEVIEVMREKLNVHDPNSRRIVENLDHMLHKPNKVGDNEYTEKVYIELNDVISEEHHITQNKEQGSPTEKSETNEVNLGSDKSIVKNVAYNDTYNNASKNNEIKKVNENENTSILETLQDVISKTSEDSSDIATKSNEIVPSDNITKDSVTQSWETIDKSTILSPFSKLAD